jgi:hypothetical protein
MLGRPNNPWGGGFDPANNPLGGGSMPNGGSVPSFGGGATPPPFTGGLPEGGASLGGQPGGGMGGPGPMQRPMMGQGNAFGQGMEQRPWQSGFLPNGNPFPGQGPGAGPMPMAQPQRPSHPMGGPGGPPPMMGQRPERPMMPEGGPRQFPREMIAAALARRQG